MWNSWNKSRKLRGQIQFHKPNLGMVYIYHWVSYSWGLSYTNIWDIMEIHNLKLEFPLPSSQFLGLLAFQGMASMQINRDKPKLPISCCSVGLPDLNFSHQHSSTAWHRNFIWKSGMWGDSTLTFWTSCDTFSRFPKVPGTLRLRDRFVFHFIPGHLGCQATAHTIAYCVQIVCGLFADCVHIVSILCPYCVHMMSILFPYCLQMVYMVFPHLICGLHILSIAVSPLPLWGWMALCCSSAMAMRWKNPGRPEIPRDFLQKTGWNPSEMGEMKHLQEHDPSWI